MSDQPEEDPDSQTYRSNRNKDILSIRRKTRDDQLWKRRLAFSNSDEIKQAQNQSNRKTGVVILDQSLRDQIEQFTHLKISSEMLDSFIEDVQASDILKQHRGLIGIKRLVASCPNLPFRTITTPQMINHLFQFALQGNYPQLQLQSLQIMASLAITEPQTSSQIIQIIMEKGVVSLLDYLLSNQHPSIQQAALLCLGNIICDGIEYRNKFIDLGLIHRIIDTLHLTNDEQVVKCGCWALSSLCRGLPLPDYVLVKPAIPLLCCYLESGCITDPQTYTECCWAISNHCEAINGKQSDLINSNLMAKLLPTLQTSADQSLQLAGLRIIGHLALGSQTIEYLLNLNLLPFLLESLNSTRKVRRRETCWVISNITASEEKHINSVLDHSGLMDKLIALFRGDDDDIKAEICHVFCNMTHLNRHLDLETLFRDYGVIECLLELLKSTNSKAVVRGLTTLNQILRMSERRNAGLNDRSAIMIELQKLNGIELLEGLQYSQSDDVYRQVSKLLKRYFEIEEEESIGI